MGFGNLQDDDIANMSKSKFKDLVEKSVNKKAFEELIESNKSKVENLIKINFFRINKIFSTKLPNPKLLLQRLQVCGRHYNCQLSLLYSTLYSLLAPCAVFALTNRNNSITWPP